ncbi:hypothetical protein RE6C_04081 [Rhodopirellula europaea 6C]|uniref:Uncharacterized protein n=1 Tax=Rhodopirellula europaea 6C TaxID=1263867 RepID=M2A577_9BACT|nr:hypothetical protein RE6C_04081 [Rhodopirellula europaea 6C]
MRHLNHSDQLKSICNFPEREQAVVVSFAIIVSRPKHSELE